MSFLDDERSIELEAKRDSWLRDYQDANERLSELKPKGRLPNHEFRERRAEREEVIREKNHALEQYRTAKDALRLYRQDLQAAAKDVARDLTDPADLIRELRQLAVYADAYKLPGGQEILDAAAEWLGPAGVRGARRR